ncbi:hypothetical protein PtA15_9A487 [Puccinia triticina]|uniref:Endonuclease/exonuclease/phosphatase domain-containing protein n=1 Tax=Puccinia triticina TaxID=208348 RepID=A0ABY7CTN6_9BASI|nr:uncharacterized protein PtA15_9A487 [Puccinia triticina]WAQ88360.1 hypothetical protein PtA15_9A487 [Puccinia triticina]
MDDCALAGRRSLGLPTPTSLSAGGWAPGVRQAPLSASQPPDRTASRPATCPPKHTPPPSAGVLAPDSPRTMRARIWGGGPSREGAAVETDESGAQNDSRGRTDTARGLGRRPIKPEPRSCAASPGRGSRESEHETTRGSHRPPSDHATRWDIAGSAQRRRLATPTGFLASIRLDLYKRIAEKLLKVATFNIRYSPLTANNTVSTQGSLNGTGEASWARRVPLIVDQIKWEAPDIEVLEHQYIDLKDQLIPSQYASVGVGRNDGVTRGEYVPLFWKTDRFKALSVNYFWLSDKPDLPGSRGWDAAEPRMVTLLTLQPRATGQSQDDPSNLPFFVMNTHFDNAGVKARTESAKLILKKANELTAAKGQPVLLMGDLNSPREETAYQVLTGKAADQPAHRATDQFFKDCGAEVGRPFGAHNATFTGFQHDPEDAMKIDYIMTMSAPPNLWQAVKYGVIPNQFQNESIASDHRMVSAVIQIV